MGRKLPRRFYLRGDTLQIARDLLGKLLVVRDENGQRVSGMIVETEAYLGETDRAAHSFGGRRTARTEATYALGGHVYVFFIYGMYYQLNVVCGEVNKPHVVLIRAVQPIDGIETMRQRRSARRASAAPSTRPRMPDKDLTNGPGKLCIAMAIDRTLNGEDLLSDTICIEEHRSFSPDEIAVGKRIGIDYAGEDAARPWRFWLQDNPFVSKPRLEISPET